jgi:hypothetical protein
VKTGVSVACLIGIMAVASLFAQAPSVVSITGRVVAGDTGQPLRLALVVLHGPGTRTTRAMMSDAEGRFTFEALPADRYRVGASKAPYVPAAIDVTAAESVITLPRGAVITGVVFTPDGRPASVDVQASGPSLPIPRTVRANIRGEYRLHSLPAGTYQVAPARGGDAVSVDVTEAGMHGAPALTHGDALPGLPTSTVAIRVDAPDSDTATIIGRVVDEVTGEGVPGVRVVALRRSGEAVTDSSGTFGFHRLGVGTYNLRVQEPGYTSINAAEVNITEGQVVVDVVLRAARQGSVSGVVRDQVGDPVVDMPVTAFQRRVVGSQPMLMGRETRTDDLGGYTVGALAHGDYFVCACAGTGLNVDPLLRQALGPTAPDAVALSRVLNESVFVYPPTWFPGVTRGGDSPMIAVGHSDDRIGLDISMSGTTPRSIAGRIMEGSVAPTRSMTLSLMQEGDLEGAMAINQILPVMLQPDGQFRFTGVPAGTYTAVAVPTASTADRGGPIGVTTVVVEDRDLDDVVITLGDGPSVSGRVTFRGAAAHPDAAALTTGSISLGPIRMSPADLATLGTTGGAGFSTRLDEQGAFALANVRPGDYRVMVSIPQSPWHLVESVAGADGMRFDGRLTVGADGETEVVVTVSDAPQATLTGTVALGPYEPASAVRVMVFPIDGTTWLDSHLTPTRFPSRLLNRDASFVIERIPPGSYFVVVAAQSEIDMSVSALGRLAERATPVTLRAGATTTVALKR